MNDWHQAARESDPPSACVDESLVALRGKDVGDFNIYF